MIPNSSIASMYVKIIGENSLLAMAQSNLLANLERISKFRTHTFISSNGQTELGISKNMGHKRYYSWEDTIIDCRNSPNIVDSDALQDFSEVVIENRRFHVFKEDMENRMGGMIKITPFYSVLLGENNMRYNIKRASKIDDFDVIRVGILLSADSDEAFKQGINNLQDWENPFKMKNIKQS